MSYRVKFYQIDHVVVLRFPNSAMATKFLTEVQTKNLLKKFRLDRRLGA